MGLPSIFPHVTAGQCTPLRLNYFFELEFLTEKADRHVIKVPINVEDNYPPRAPQPPPPMPSESHPSAAWSSQAPPRAAPQAISHSDAPPAYHNGSISHAQPPPPSYGSPPSNFHGACNQPPPQFQEPSDFSSSEPGLYPRLPGITAYQPTSDSFMFAAPPPFNPAYPPQQ